MENMALLEVRSLTVRIKQNNKLLQRASMGRNFQYPEAVRGIDFDINPGEIAALAGESGGGKTLTGLSILQLLPTAVEIGNGSIMFDSVSLTSLAEDELYRIRGKSISMIFQEPRQSLNPLHRIGRQIIEALELHGEKDRETSRRAALEMLASMGFSDPDSVFRAYPHQLSPGMCQRAMIAIASICRPKLLIADEPTSSLDTATGEQVLALLKKMNRDFNTAILLITHDLPVIRHFCTRIMVMYAGRIIEAGPTETIFAQPAHPYTQALIKALPGPEQKGKPLPDLDGRSPSIEEQMQGCPFAQRCPVAQSRCHTAPPQQSRPGNEHLVYCHHAEAANA